MKPIILILAVLAIMPALGLAEDCVCPCPCDPQEPITYSSGIVINELMPNPSGEEEEEEWIELKNTNSEDVDLCSWQLKDASGKTYTLESSVIAANGYLTIYRSVSSIALNNSGMETVELYQPDGNLLSTTTYSDTAQEDYSYARQDDDVWAWTSAPTPNAENNFPVEISEPIEEEEPAPEKTISYDLSKNIILSEIYPDPNEGEEEFIELKNTGEQAVDLNGWQIQDASDKKYTIDEATKIEKYLVITNSVSLNNDGDTIKLIQPDGNVLDKVTYEKTEKGKSYYWKKDKWQWSDAPTPGEDNKEQAVEKNSYSNKLIITELLPDPDGSDSTDEFIEIFNNGSEKIDLLNWSLSDNSRTYAWSESFALNPNQYQSFYITETKISLNNSGETITLKNPDGETVSEIIYEQARMGFSYCLDAADNWAWSNNSTPGEINVIAMPVEGEEKIESEDEYLILSISEAQEQEKGTKIQIEGIVSVLPGVLGAQYFYVQDDEAGIQVYSSKKDFTEFKIGDVLRVKGEASEAYGEKKINIQSQSDIEIIDSNWELPSTQIDELAEDLVGMLVYTESQILELSSTKIILSNGILVYIKSDVEFDKKLYIAGDVIKVTGIVGEYKEEYRLMPRSQDDVAKTATAQEAEDNSLIKSAQAAEASNSQTNLAATEDDKKIGQYLIAAAFIVFILMVLVLSKINLKKFLRGKIATLLADGEKSTMAKDGQNRYHE